MGLIAIDGRKYFDYGIGTYVRELVRSLRALESAHKFLLYSSPEDTHAIPPSPGWEIVEVGYKKYSLQEILLLGRRAKRQGVQVFHEPHYTLPIGLGGRSVVTIHDIIHLRFPQYFSRLERTYSYPMVWHSLNHSRFVITDSDFTKQDILSTFHLEEKRIKVIPEGVGGQYRPMKNTPRIGEFKKQFGIQAPFILFVGNIKPHKDLPTLLEAFRILRRSKDVDLAIVGGLLRQDPSLARQAVEWGISDHIKELGHLTDEELVLAYNAAEALVLPSRYEGFGLPALEAMACGTPVIVSNAASLPEVVGNAAVIFGAGNAAELGDSLATVLRESSLQQDLIRKGKDRASKFTWTNAAKQTLALYDHIASA